MSRQISLRRLLTTAILPWAVLSCFCQAPARAGDWPQMLGPHRDGQAVDEKLAQEWSTSKPAALWQFQVGEGYAGPAILGERVLVFHRLGNSEVLTCLSASQGEQLWETRWPTSYAGGVDSDHGPRCVPLIDQDAVFVYGASGNLHCASLNDGKKRWSRPLARDYKALEGYFGAGSGPLIAEDLVIVNVGGKKQGAGIVAVDKGSGTTRWTLLEDDGSYSAPVLRPSAEGPCAVFVTRLNVVGLQPKNGKVVFQFPFGKSGPTVNAATPTLVGEDRLFVTASYGIGAKLVSTAGNVPHVEWESDQVLSSQYPTPVLVGEQLYGVHGREDGAPAELRCIDVRTGKIRWSRPGFGMAHVIVADQKLLVQRTAGELLLLAADPNAYQELGKITITESVARAHPALSRGRYYLRDTSGQLAVWRLP